MSYINPTPWSFVRPKTCQIQAKLFSLEQKPFTGKRLNKAKLIRSFTNAEIKNSLRLSALPTVIPNIFSWRDKADSSYKGKIERPRDQGECGSCWAFAIAMALGDRYAIKYGINNPYLSPTWLMSKTYNLMQVRPQDSCNEGGDPFAACKWLEESNSIKLESCWPYNMIVNHKWISPNPLPNDCCSTCCDDKILSKINQLYTIQPNSTKSLIVFNNGQIDKNATISAIQREIMSNGPVITGFQVYDDFMTYWNYGAPKKQIYVCNNRGGSGGHAVTITGWGTGTVQSGKTVRYWELRNTWGTYSGDGGYGYVAFSTDEPKNINLQIDIPQEYYRDPRTGEVQWSGGIFTLSPGSLPIQNSSDASNINFEPDINLISNDNNKNNSGILEKGITIFGLKIPIYVIILFSIILIILILNK